MTELKIATGKPYQLSRDVRLRANRTVEVFIPVQIMEPAGTPFSELVRLSNDNARVGSYESPQEPGNVTAIVVELLEGDELSLGRSSEVVFVSGTSDFVQLREL
ncbi:MAG: hypothetical protein ABJH52_09750 [Henriciella sp.]